MSKHTGTKWWNAKSCLTFEFGRWCKKLNVEQSPENMIEFLYQKGFIQGRKWLNYLDGAECPLRRFLDSLPLKSKMIEGFIPGNTWIGRREK